MAIDGIRNLSHNTNRSNHGFYTSDLTKQQEKHEESEQHQRDRPLTLKESEQFVDAFNRLAELSRTHLKFTAHEKSGEIYVQVIDEQSNEVVREIPSKKVLDIISNLQEHMGILFDKKV